MNHPYEHIKKLMGETDEFVLTKRSWDGFSGSDLWEFVVLDAGPVWFRFQIIHNSARQVTINEPCGHPRWITWKDFGSFGIKVDGKPI